MVAQGLEINIQVSMSIVSMDTDTWILMSSPCGGRAFAPCMGGPGPAESELRYQIGIVEASLSNARHIQSNSTQNLVDPLPEYCDRAGYHMTVSAL